jgi:hypothetical protein
MEQVTISRVLNNASGGVSAIAEAIIASGFCLEQFVVFGEARKLEQL